MIRRDLAEKLGQAVVREGLVTDEQLQEVLSLKEAHGKDLYESLLDLRFLSEGDLLKVLSQVSGVTYLEDLPIRSQLGSFRHDLPIQYARRHHLIPFVDPETGEVMVAVNRLDEEVIENVSNFLLSPVTPVLATRKVISEAINLTYERSSESAEEVIGNLENGALAIRPGDLEEPQDLLDASDEAPIINFVNSILYEAVRDRASDIHVEPFEGDLSIRYRVDGVLHNVHTLQKRLHSPIISRIKVMADLDIAEKRLPQDGRIRIKIAGKDIDIRVSTVPTSFGERGVLRLLDRSQVLLGLEEIGMAPDHLKEMERLANQSHGITLVTGPTGSGKTTTLYAALTRINSADKNIITVEDPVEYQLKGISQIQVNPKIDLTFANGLRSILRQDPNVIMVGEIRDLVTAEIAIQASLTGHLVFSTLHTNDASGAVTRLIDMGVEPFLVVSSLTAILAQRLIRRICPHCKVPYRPIDEELAELGIETAQIPTEGLQRGEGCPRCIGTGYLGRTGIYELLRVTEGIKGEVLRHADSGSIKNVAIEEGMRTLRQDGALKVLKGVTTIEEVLRVTQEEMENAAV
ncbi:MAG: type II secretion system ATPase GspE [bacterium]|nr:MAG: type II secretion system ATPase GspE [bacterium]